MSLAARYFKENSINKLFYKTISHMADCASSFRATIMVRVIGVRMCHFQQNAKFKFYKSLTNKQTIVR